MRSVQIGMKSSEHVCRPEEKAGETIVTDAAAWGKVAEPCRLRRLNIREGMGPIHYVTGDASQVDPNTLPKMEEK